MNVASGKTSSETPRQLFATLKDDIVSVTNDIKRRGVRRAMVGPLASLEAFYLTEEDRRRLAELHGFQRFLRRAWWLARGLLMKLTPARRIMLGVALVLLLFGRQELRFDTKRVSIGLPGLASPLLLVVLMLELKDKLIARDELEGGRAVQLALMPGHRPEVPGWDVWLYTRPANDVGGDLVDHLRIDAGHHFVALGDVAGKALPAALLSVKLQATLRALAPSHEDLGDLGAAVNRILHRDGLPNRFASLVYMRLSSDSGRIRLLNAGHMPPYVIRNGSVSQIDRGSMVLGLVSETSFFEQHIDLEEGDALVAYSDGISEAMNEAGDFFGDERLLALVGQTAALGVETIGSRILDAVAAFVGDAIPSDDVSLVVLKRRAPTGL